MIRPRRGGGGGGGGGDSGREEAAVVGRRFSGTVLSKLSVSNMSNVDS